MSSSRGQYEGRDFYEVFGVNKDASVNEIRRAYRVLALRVHPDKNPSPTATRDFQTLGHIMETLTDPDRRRVYDLTGAAGHSEESNNEHWTEVFRKVTEADIKAYEATYHDSEEERQDILSAYLRCAGDVDKMLEWIPLSNEKSLDTISRIVHAAIAAKETIDKQPIILLPKFLKTIAGADQRYQNKYAHEASLAASLKSSLLQKLLPPKDKETTISIDNKRLRTAKFDDDDDDEKKELALIARDTEYEWGGQLATIQKSMRQREKERHEKMVQEMQLRYAPKTKKRKTSNSKKKIVQHDYDDDIPEHEFQRIQRKLLHHKSRKHTKPK